MSALESYSAASAREVLYDARLATGRRSVDVQGVFAPPEALRILLGNSGLVGRYVSGTSVVIVPSSPPASVQKPARTVSKMKSDPVMRDRYYGAVQARIRNVFCRNALLRPGRYRIAVRFWIAPTGAVQQAKLLSKTGNSRVDSAIEPTLRGLNIGQVPPPGVSQPFTMVVLPRTPGQTQDCAGIDAVRYTGDAN